MPQPTSVKINLDRQFADTLETILKTKGFDYLLTRSEYPGMICFNLQIMAEPGDLCQFGFITGFEVAMTLRSEGIKIDY